jgi:hypothetical protein
MTNEKQQTAVEWYIDELEKYEKGTSEYFSIPAIQNHARKMETEKLKDAYDWGETNGADECNGDGATHENFEQYYQETYGGKK